MRQMGQRLKTLRRINHISPERVMEILYKDCKMKYSVAALYKWEENIVEPDIHILLALAYIYQSSVSYIIDDSILELHDLSIQEANMLELYRKDEVFMRIAMLMLKYINQ